MTSVCYYIENAFKQKGMLSAHALLLPEIEGIAVIVFRDDQSEYPELWIQQSGSDNDEYVFTCRDHPGTIIIVPFDPIALN